MWEYGVCVKGITYHCGSINEAEWRFLKLMGENKDPEPFKKLKITGEFVRVEWNPNKIINSTNAPYKVFAQSSTDKTIYAFNFFKKKSAVDKALYLLHSGTKVQISVNVNGTRYEKVSIRSLVREDERGVKIWG